MIACPVCGQGNDDLATVCVSCRGFIQSKVDALDLFSTCWMIIEAPSRAFRRIALASHKNYALFLSSLFGIVWTYMFLWAIRAGTDFPNLFAILVGGILLGPPVGVVIVATSAALSLAVGRTIGGKSGFRNSSALTAYSLTPVVFSLVFIIPVDFAVFGLSLFGAPPGPWELKPVIYSVLIGLHTGAFLWSVALLVISSRIAHGISLLKAVLVGVAAAAAISSPVLIPVMLSA